MERRRGRSSGGVEDSGSEQRSSSSGSSSRDDGRASHRAVEGRVPLLAVVLERTQRAGVGGEGGEGEGAAILGIALGSKARYKGRKVLDQSYASGAGVVGTEPEGEAMGMEEEEGTDVLVGKNGTAVRSERELGGEAGNGETTAGGLGRDGARGRVSRNGGGDRSSGGGNRSGKRRRKDGRGGGGKSREGIGPRPGVRAGKTKTKGRRRRHARQGRGEGGRRGDGGSSRGKGSKRERGGDRAGRHHRGTRERGARRRSGLPGGGGSGAGRRRSSSHRRKGRRGGGRGSPRNAQGEGSSRRLDLMAGNEARRVIGSGNG